MDKKQQKTKLVDVDAEREFVGKFVSGTANVYASQAIEVVKTDYITDVQLQDIWRVIADQVASGDDKIEMMKVYVAVVKKNPSITVSDIASIAASATTGSLDELMYYLADLGKRRELIAEVGRVIASASDQMNPLEAVVNEVKSLGTKIDADSRKGLKSSSDVIMSMLYAAQDRKNGVAVSGYHSGFTCIDKRGGLIPTDLDVIAGESSMGKTSFALAIALNAAQANVPMAIYSLEMSLEQLAARLVSMSSGTLSSSDILHRPLSDSEFANMQQVATGLCGTPMYFDDSSVQTIDKLTASIRRMVRTYGVKGVLIDYLQLLSLGKSNGNRVDELAIISRTLKNLAKELNIFVLLLSQLNRPKENSDPTPSMRRLRGSGEIEEAADNIYFVYRPIQYKRGYSNPWEGYDTHNSALIIIGKARNSCTGEDMVWFNPECTLFYDDGRKPDRTKAVQKAKDKVDELLSQQSGVVPY